MIELIAPTHCPFCNMVMTCRLQNNKLECANNENHIPANCWVWLNWINKKAGSNSIETVNILLNNNYQFSFQKDKTIVLDRTKQFNTEEEAWVYCFTPPLQVELNLLKLEDKIKTILTFL